MPGWEEQGQLGHNSHFSWVSQVAFLSWSCWAHSAVAAEETGEQRSAKSSSFPESWSPWTHFCIHPPEGEHAVTTEPLTFLTFQGWHKNL